MRYLKWGLAGTTALVLLALTCLYLPGQTCKKGEAKDYFPYTQTTEATFDGKGNEFAPFTLHGVAQQGTKVEWRRANGGTTLAEVFDVLPQQVTAVYREAEVYDDHTRIAHPPNVSDIILKGPIKVGTEWTSSGATYKITSVTEKIQALNTQTLSCVVRVDVTTQGSLTQNYYHRQYGWVLSVFNPNQDPIESRLATFMP